MGRKKDKPRNCSRCSNFRFTRMTRWCSVDSTRMTYPMAIYNEYSAGTCKDFNEGQSKRMDL